MASPPFSISTTTPGDSDIVSQYPLNERGTRDIVQSWLLANHDTNGNHAKVIFPWQVSTPSTPAASLITVYADANGRLKIVYPDGSVGFVGNPPGTIIHYSSTSTPVGYLVADGSAVSRSTYADLFAVIGTAYGIGDGSTTFNLPDIKGRVIAGEDPAGVRLTAAGLGAAANLPAAGGGETTTLLATNLPSYTPTGTLSGTVSGTDTILVNGNVAQNLQGGTTGFGWSNSPVVKAISASVGWSGTFSGTNNGGASTPYSRVQPTIVLKALIKI